MREMHIGFNIRTYSGKPAPRLRLSVYRCQTRGIHATFGRYFRIDTLKKRRRRYVHISHRGGAAETYENTLQGFRRAVDECGTEMLELDVRMTADGEVVVSHDMHLGRLCGVDARVDQGGVNRSCRAFVFLS